MPFVRSEVEAGKFNAAEPSVTDPKPRGGSDQVRAHAVVTDSSRGFVDVVASGAPHRVVATLRGPRLESLLAGRSSSD